MTALATAGLCAAFAALLTVAGCHSGSSGSKAVAAAARRKPVTTTVIIGPSNRIGGRGVQSSADGSTATLSPQARLATDPCPLQMQDIGGALLVYLRDNNDLPAKLEDLRRPPYAALAQGLEFVCPDSGRPYSYEPRGLVLPGNPSRLVLWDSEPDHDGKRWGLVLSPAQGDRQPSSFVIPLTDALLKSYQLTAE